MHAHMQLKTRLQTPGKPDQSKCIHCARQHRDYALLTVQVWLKQEILAELRLTTPPYKLGDLKHSRAGGHMLTSLVQRKPGESDVWQGISLVFLLLWQQPLQTSRQGRLDNSHSERLHGCQHLASMTTLERDIVLPNWR